MCLVKMCSLTTDNIVSDRLINSKEETKQIKYQQHSKQTKQPKAQAKVN